MTRSGLGGFEEFQQRQTVAGLPDDLEVRILLDDSLDPLTKQHVIIS